MYLNQITGNILNKFNNQPINVVYEPQRNLFDVLLAECGIRLFSPKGYNFEGLGASNLSMLDNTQFDLFNYNVGISNNIIDYSSNKKFIPMHLNSIIFTHSYSPQQIKKEDLLLLDQNFTRETKVFFSANAAKSWRFTANNIVYNYGIPTNLLFKENNVRNNRILLLNFEKSSNIQSLAQFLVQHNIQVDIVENIHFDIQILRELFNKYDVCIDLGDHNIINLLVAISCGCKAITYNTDMVQNDYSSVPNLYAAKTVQDLINVIKQATIAPLNKYEEYIKTNYCFDKFKRTTLNLINQANNEAFII